MDGVIIEEINSSSEEEYNSPRSNSEEPKFHDAAEDFGDRHSAGGGEDRSSSGAAVKAANKTEAHTLHNDDEDKDLTKAEELKLEGNALFGRGEYSEALESYEKALRLAPEEANQQRAVYLANSAAVHLKLENFPEAARCCGASLSLEPPTSLQIKALTRRSTAYENLDELDKALQDYEKLIELDPSNVSARKSAGRLKPIVAERQEKMKEEMIGKLKELGNTVLGKFGMSIDNFKAEKDPTTGAYSINFKQ